MNQIKVRALGKDGYWRYGIYPSPSPEMSVLTMTMENFWHILHFSPARIRRETLGLWTGICDNNNNDIYDGDIVQYDTEDGIVTAKIIFKEDDGDDAHISGFYTEYMKVEDYPEDNDEPVRFLVVGNIYEPKE